MSEVMKSQCDYSLPKCHTNRLQHIQNALAWTVVQAPKFQHITPILQSLHWLKVSERIEYKFIYLTYKILNTTQPSYLYDLSDLISIQPPRGHNTRSSLYVTLIKPSSSLSHSPLIPTCFTSSLEPASYITQNSSSESFISLSVTFIWTCRFNLLHTAITFHHFFTVSLWAQNLPFQKILSSTLVCFCLSDWSHGSRLFTGLICSSVLCFGSFFCFSYS